MQNLYTNILRVFQVYATDCNKHVMGSDAFALVLPMVEEVMDGSIFEVRSQWMKGLQTLANEQPVCFHQWIYGPPEERFGPARP